MSIRKQLFIAFGVLAILVIAIATTFVIYTHQSKILLDNSLDVSKQLSAWKEISVSIDRQARNLNYFIILGDIAERDKFNEQVELVNLRLKAIKADRIKFNTLYLTYVNLSQKLFKIPAEKKFRFYESKLLPVEKTLREMLENEINTYSKMLNSIQSTVKNSTTRNFAISLILGTISIFIAVVLGLGTFRSIWNPLKKLISGTKIIGEGNLEYKIEIPHQHEIGKLAESFNKMVENLKNLQFQIIQMDRMSSMGQLAGGVAHEINNPLTGVLGQAQILLEKLPKDHPDRVHVERIEQAAQRCRKIVRALLDFARERNYVFQIQDINSLIRDTLNFCETELHSAGIELHMKIPENLPKVLVSPHHIQQVFLNIINNAVDAMRPKGGMLYITAKHNNNNFLDISFRDTGHGIKKEDLSHIFDPFFTTKDVGKGTGLGLSVSYGIIQRHNGKITAFSDGENCGAEFVVSLPIVVA